MMDGVQYRCSDVAAVDGEESAAADRYDGSEVTTEMPTHHRFMQITYALLTRSWYHADGRQCAQYVCDCNQLI